jgi:hypothetical protein
MLIGAATLLKYNDMILLVFRPLYLVCIQCSSSVPEIAAMRLLGQFRSHFMLNQQCSCGLDIAFPVCFI